ncbi:aldehyde dehydrogenase family protein [Mesorhizobium sp. RIZ17]|uniref:aldehyde dehydrogenase family protein n=1 Tax=Mesorhizobium sp. RIZ17 TaxID=3132743 RepID=UPI003DA98F46
MLVVKQSVGVAASMVARRIPPVLPAGCAVILKPAEQTPRVVAGAILAAEADFPEGVVDLIHACKGDAIGRS